MRCRLPLHFPHRSQILADPKTWIFALGQAFFSLSVAGNGTLIYGSYLSDEKTSRHPPRGLPCLIRSPRFLAASSSSRQWQPPAQTDQVVRDFSSSTSRTSPLNAGRYVDRDYFLRSILFAGMTSCSISTKHHRHRRKNPPQCASCLRTIGIIGAAVSC